MTHTLNGRCGKCKQLKNNNMELIKELKDTLYKTLSFFTADIEEQTNSAPQQYV